MFKPSCFFLRYYTAGLLYFNIVRMEIFRLVFRKEERVFRIIPLLYPGCSFPIGSVPYMGR